MLNRRTFLGAAAMSAVMLPATRIWAGSKMKLGAVQVDTLSDGNLVLPADFILGGMPEAELKVIVEKFGLSTQQLTPPCNVTLVRDGTNTVLFDVGAGPDFQPSAGKLAEALEALDVAFEDVTHVVFTHGHPDHLWGMLDEFDEPIFANAVHMMGQAEFDYWTDPDTAQTIGAARTAWTTNEPRIRATPEPSGTPIE